MYTDNDVSLINNIIYEYLPINIRYAEKLEKAIHSAIKNGGKRIRPMLMSQTYKLYSDKNIAQIGAFLAAIEFIHGFSLIHDDLPCIDNDTLRRGYPTTWYAYGQDIAVLAGDALSLHASNIIFNYICTLNDNKEIERATRAGKVLCDKSGVFGMIAGECVDVIKTGKLSDINELEYMYELKTAALIQASLMIGGILGGASKEDILLLEKIGYNIGVAFQIADDILDITKTSEQLGKNANSDEKNNKTTYVTFYGIEKARKKIYDLSQNALALVSELKIKNSNNNSLNELKYMVNYLINREK